MKKILAIAIATAISAPAMADLTIGGSARYQVTDTDGATATAGRVQLAVSGRSEGANGAFASYGATVNLNMGSTNAQAATTAGGSTLIESTFTSTEAIAFDDVTLTIGNADANVQLGEFETFKAFSSGADTFEAANTSNGLATSTAAAAALAGGYENSAIFGRNSGNVQVNLTSIDNLGVSVASRITDADTSVVLGLSTAVSGVSVKAAIEDDSAAGTTGVSATAGMDLNGVALNVSYGKKGTAKSSNINASYMGFGVAMQKNENGANEEDRIFGSYTLEDVAGIAGADVIVGAGSAEYNTTASKDIFGVRLSYAF
ncbi:hypothetical protein [Marinobacterium sp. LSUCC0821]|uniref:hypothetical protein n=1 Tax=Marinobacterium sp. LSUCC0821 TaxID=2668067 RepID=UPI001451597A|nr:hypothetical protein [Marinobacterium sp. LSUCC0821]QJD71086.1 hypothetical protein HH196_04975 [Marinobacterium sp. LSUCC0821]